MIFIAKNLSCGLEGTTLFATKKNWNAKRFLPNLFVGFFMLFALMGFHQTATAQTSLAAGDIAIIGFNTNTTPDDMVILVLKDLSAGTVFYVNDNEVLTAGGSAFADLNEAEASFTVKAGQSISKGTVIVLPWGGGLTSTTTYDWNVTAGAGLGNGEEIYIYNASSITATSATSFIFGVTQGANTGLRPNGLTDGTTWIDHGSLRAYRYNTTGATYSGTQAQLLAAIGNAANHTGAATYAFTPADWTFTITSGTPTVNLSVSTNSASETSPTAITVTATASAAVTGDQTVNLGVTGTGITAGDYTLSNTTITIPGGSTTGTVTFTVVDDADVEASETATLTISSPSAGITLGSTTTQNISIADNDVSPNPTVNLSVSANAGTEAGTTAITVTATASAAVSGSQTVSLAVTGTGITSGDYTLSSTTISIADGATSGTVTFTVADDALVEGAETATLTISSPSAGIALGATTTQNITITDNDTPVATTLAAGDIAVIGYNTSGAPDNFAILVLKDLSAGTVFYINDNEVASTGGTSFTDLGEGEASFTVKAGQTIPKGTVIVLPWGAAAVSTTTYDYSATSSFGLGNNNEEIYIYTASAITSLTPTAFIYFAKIGTSASSVPAGLTSGTSAITPTGSASRYKTTGALYDACQADLLSAIANIAGNWQATAPGVAGDWTFTVQPTCAPVIPSVQLSVSSNSGTEAGATAITVTATASAAVTGDQTVSLAVTGSGITAGDYSLSNTTITIPNGATTGTVTFTVVDDAEVETTETAALTISSPSAGITLGTTTSQNISITDNDVSPNPTVNLSVSANAGSEAGTTAITVTATSSAAVSGNQTINLAVGGTGITAGDYSLSSTTITIADGTTTGTVTFTVADDAVVEGTETAVLTISSPSAGITLGTTTTQNIVITDNDAALDINLCNYVRVGRYDLPEPTRTTAPANSVLAQEVSAVTYNWDTQTLFVVGDGGTSIVQVSKTGQLINSMTLATGNSPQGTEFYDPEGLTYVGNGKFVMTEERDRNAVQFTYVAGSTLTRANAQTVHLGTFVQNIGLEGLTYDPLTGGYIFVKEITPLGIFQTDIDFNAGTATNGSASTVNSVDLFNPALTGLSDFADVYALANIPSLSTSGNLLVLSQEDGRIVNIDRSGNISSTLQIVSDPGNPLTLSAQQHEGLTMDSDGILYVVSENGGGDFDHPQLWVYAPSTTPNQAPTAVALSNSITSIAENTSTTARVKIADIDVVDDGLGCNNTLSLSGVDASFFEIVGTQLFIKAGTVIDYETKTSYSITINVDDASIGGTPDASFNYTLTVTDVLIETPAGVTLIVSEVAPWSSGNSPVAGDWFELTNTGTVAVNISGWKVDDNSNSFASSVALNGITSIAPGESVIFIESAAPSTVVPAFLSNWFGSNPPAGLQVGTYTGGGVGLSTGGDAVNVFNGAGELQAKVIFGASPAGPSFPTFNNALGLNNTTISTLSAVGVNDAFVAVNSASEIGSPGTIGKLYISEVAPWSSGNSPVGADWFEVTNTKATAVDITGWKVDDNSGSPAAAVALNGITSIAPGESVIFIESATPATVVPSFLSNWFGSTPPASLQIGTYTGSGVGFGTSGDQVNLYNSTNVLQTGVSFGASPTGPYRTFDNAAKLSSITPAITTLSTVGVNGAFIAFNSNSEIGSPGSIVSPACATITVTATQGAAISCNGGNTTITVSVAGGTAPYTGTGTFTVAAGTYNYTVTDAYGCSGTTSITVEQPTAIDVAAAAGTIVCPGGSATLTVTASGGTGALQYSIDGGSNYQTENTFTVVAGTYTVTVKDANNCVVSSSPVTVDAAVDNTLPTITAPADVTLAANSACVATGVDLGTPITADNCSVASVSNNAPSTYPLGTTSIIWTVTDAAGNTATATQLVIITGTSETWYLDADGDGYYVSSTTACSSPGAGYVNSGVNAQGDCNDNDASVYLAQPTGLSAMGGSATITASATGATQFSINGTTYQPSGIFTGLSAGTYTVYARNTAAGCVASITGIVVSGCTPLTAPYPPTPTINTANVCGLVGNASATARVTATVSANTVAYRWKLPAGVVCVSSYISIVGSDSIETSTNFIDIRFETGFVPNSTINVRARSACGILSTSPRSVVLRATPPITPVIQSWNGTSNISAIINVCPAFNNPTDALSQTVQYVIPRDMVATGYAWTVSDPATMIIQGAANDTIVGIRFSSSFTSGSITITKISGCGSAIRTLTIRKNAPFKPGALLSLRNGTVSPFFNICDVVGTTEFVRYQLTAVPLYATAYNWSVSNTATMTIVGGGTASDNYVDVQFASGFTTGQVIVTSQNSCGISAPSMLTIKPYVPIFPAGTTMQSSMPSGPLLCGATNVILTTSAVATDSTTEAYRWSLPTGITPNASIAATLVGSFTGGKLYSTTGNSIAIDWGAVTKSAKISVAPFSNCGSGVAVSLILTATPTQPAVINEVQNCPTPRTYNYSVPDQAGATIYTWRVPYGVVLNSGQGTSSITVTYPATAVTGYFTVTVGNTCGAAVVRTLLKTAFTPPACTGGRSIETIVDGKDLYTATTKAVVIPNPNNGIFDLRINTANTKDNAQIQLLDLQGRIVMNFVGINNKGLIQTKVNLGQSVTNGIYLVKYTIGTETGNAKVLIQR